MCITYLIHDTKVNEASLPALLLDSCLAELNGCVGKLMIQCNPNPQICLYLYIPPDYLYLYAAKESWRHGCPPPTFHATTAFLANSYHIGIPDDTFTLSQLLNHSTPYIPFFFPHLQSSGPANHNPGARQMPSVAQVQNFLVSCERATALLIVLRRFDIQVKFAII